MIDFDRLILFQADHRRGFVIAGARGNFDHATKNMRNGIAFLVHLDAELGAEVGDDGGGSADGKQGIRD